jgi:hypothetical protein
MVVQEQQRRSARMDQQGIETGFGQCLGAAFFHHLEVRGKQTRPGFGVVLDGG